MPSDELTQLANRFGSDKGDTVLCAHTYTRVYEALLAPVREQPIRLLEIGLMHGHTQDTMQGRLHEVGCPSLKMWAEYLPRAEIFGFDIVDFSALSEPRMTIFQGDQSKPEDLAHMAEQVGGPFDIIIDDGSHASHHQQIALATLFEHLAPGGLYCIEDLHYQPSDMEWEGITKTRAFLRELRFGGTGARIAMEQASLATLLSQMASVHFFDSQSARWSLAQREDALAIIVKRGIHPLLGDVVNSLPQGGSLAQAGAPQATGSYAQLPASFVGHAAIHGQRVYCGSAVSSPDPRYWVAHGSGTQAAIIPSGQLASYQAGEAINFRQGGNALLYQRQGWDFSSPGGTWTIAPTARLALKLVGNTALAQKFSIELVAQGMVGPSHPVTRAELVINGMSLGVYAFGHEQTLQLPFHPPANALSDGVLEMELRVLDPVSPHSLGLSEDKRELGVLLIRLRITPEND
ncbi:MAG: hypothetical protein HYX43_13145 [Burkholderiales bacterium]|nr:hypothetical protein [Burkholderiales bacterium]